MKLEKNLDLLLVTPPTQVAVYQGLSSKGISALEPPVWSGLIATFMRNRGYSVGMLDAEAMGLGHEQAAKDIAAASPRFVVFVVYGQQPSGSTQCMPGGRAVAKALQKEAPGLPTLVMGTHSSALPERTLREEPYTFVCGGEGPLTVLGVTEEIKKGTRRFDKVPGLWYWNDGKPAATAPAPKIAKLDEDLPGQAWDLLDMSLYRAHNWHCFDHIDKRKPYASLQTSLGCPFKCSFCCINAPFGGPGIRYWSPDNIIGQIDTLVDKYGVQNIKFPDEMFVLNEAHVIGICDRIIERGYDLNIWAYARIDTVKEKFLQKLRKAGFRWLVLGIESGSKHVRDGVEKGRFKDTDIGVTVKKVQDAGVYVMGNYIFGLPDDTLESMQETLDMSLELNTEWANFYSAMAYPGSQLYPMALKKGWQLPSDWIGYSQHAFETLPLPTETLTGPEVLAFRDAANETYFTNPAYLSLVERKFGKPVVEHIRSFMSYKLKRQFVPDVAKTPAKKVAA